MKTWMKQGWLLAALLMMSVMGSMAQERGDRPHHDRRPPMDVEEQCTKLISLLELDKAAAEQFVPTFKQYREEMMQLFKQHRPTRPQRPHEGEAPQLSDTEVEARILGRFAMSRAIVDVREKYYHLFRRFMSPHQILKLYEMEQHNAQRMNNEHHQRRAR